ncbi:hypothetical protein [Paenibacillus sp. N3.4]|uniref:hypothetical protein n=1 Tax=Paenibacillus sp. N3.4 TaxID=2603222 RepID=UPI001C9C0CA7|nr:hypothetical protein [Paenibacillus sp. N3.4]
MVQGNRSITGIADINQLAPATVKNDFLRMINKGLLTNCYMDEQSMRIVFYNDRTTQNGEVDNPIIERDDWISDNGPESPQLLPKMVECSGCGSSSLLQPSEIKPCPYCDTSLTYR